MARTTTVRLTDDIDGSAASETVSFALDGQPYEIDLSTEHAQRLRGSLTGFVASARTTGRVDGRSRHARRHHGRPAEVDASALRAWAKENNVHVSHRGRIPADVVAQYKNAQGAVPAAPAAEPVPEKRKRSRRKRN